MRLSAIWLPGTLAILLLGLLASPAFALCTSKPANRFDARGEVATDPKTGLIWKRCAVGMKWRDDTGRCSGTPEPLSMEDANAAAKNAGAGWRIPTGREMDSLFLNTCKGPKIDTRVFPDVAASDFGGGEGAAFWSTSQAMPGMFYYFDLVDGTADMHSPGFSLSVLLVKNATPRQIERQGDAVKPLP